VRYDTVFAPRISSLVKEQRSKRFEGGFATRI